MLKRLWLLVFPKLIFFITVVVIRSIYTSHLRIYHSLINSRLIIESKPILYVIWFSNHVSVPNSRVVFSFEILNCVLTNFLLNHRNFPLSFNPLTYWVSFITFINNFSNRFHYYFRRICWDKFKPYIQSGFVFQFNYHIEIDCNIILRIFISIQFLYGTKCINF